MARSYVLLILIIISQTLSAQRVTGIYTDFNYRGQGYWHANGSVIDTHTPPTNTDQPSNSHLLLAFTWSSITYTTGVNDALLDNKFPQNNFVKRSFRAFPVAYLPPAGSGTYVGVGYNYGGAGNSPLTNNSMEYYLTDGIRGFDLGTGVYNLPKTGAGTTNQPSKYTVTQIAPVNLNEPIVVISQMGQPGSTSSEDVFYFVDGNGQLVGNKKSVAFSGINGVGWGHFKFYSVGANSLNFVSSPAGSRVLRFIAYSLNDFGINAANAGSVRQFWQELSGSSDQAFIGAYNTEAIEIAQSVSGFVYANGQSTHGAAGYAGATVRLYKSDGTTVVASAITNGAGYYLFGDVPKGNYIIRVTAPAGQYIADNSNNNTTSDILIAVDEEPVTTTYFSLAQALPVNFENLSAKISGSGLNVYWSTIGERNNSYFEVELSSDGNVFNSIGKVASKAPEGNSDVRLHYEMRLDSPFSSYTPMILGLLLTAGFISGFTSRKTMTTTLVITLIFLSFGCSRSESVDVRRPEKRVYIRISQVDIDGSKSYSKVIRVFDNQ